MLTKRNAVCTVRWADSLQRLSDEGYDGSPVISPERVPGRDEVFIVEHKTQVLVGAVPPLIEFSDDEVVNFWDLDDAMEKRLWLQMAWLWLTGDELVDDGDGDCEDCDEVVTVSFSHG